MHQLRLTDKAITGVERIASYITRKFSPELAKRYQAGLNGHLIQICTNPHGYQAYNGKARYGKRLVRQAIFNKRTLIVFRVLGNEVEIIAIRDTRSNWK